MSGPLWAVVENTPGYLPEDDDPGVFDTYAEACAYANQLADELEEDGYTTERFWASEGNYYAIRACRDERDLGRFIAVELVEED
jgi:hypothetical protein